MVVSKLTCVFICIYLISCGLHAQDLPYAKAVISTLCSNDYKGRGYVDGGDRKAATFIADEFGKCGLSKFGKSYFQKFDTPINTFPGKVTVKVNGIELVPGQDFIVEPGSPSIQGSFKTIALSADDLLKQETWVQKAKGSAGKCLVIQAFDKSKYNSDQLKQINEVISYLTFSSDNPAKGTIIITNDKLTWSGSTELTNAGVTIKASALPAEVNDVELDIESKFIKNYETQNVVGYIEGENKDSLLVFSAHYDHLGMMGRETIFPGANDNASGVAMLLNMVKHYAKSKPKYTLVFIAFAAEEIGLVGSAYYTKHPLFPLSKIKFLINFDLAGTGDDGLQVVNGKIYQDKFNVLTQINTEKKLLKQIKIRGEACNSDHCMFHQKGVKCFYMYTLGGIQAYHDIYDKAETLPLTEFEDYFRLLTEFIGRL